MQQQAALVLCVHIGVVLSEQHAHNRFMCVSTRKHERCVSHPEHKRIMHAVKTDEGDRKINDGGNISCVWSKNIREGRESHLVFESTSEPISSNKRAVDSKPPLAM
jgi:hypothetical protein